MKAEEKGDCKAQEAGKRPPKEQEKHLRERRVNLNCVLERLEHCPYDQVRTYDRIEEKEHEEFVVAKADAIIYPGAMMVHSEDASLANAAMMTSIWLVLRAPFAAAALARPFALLERLRSRISVLLRHIGPLRVVIWDLARVCKDTPCVRNSQQHGDVIEPNNFQSI